MLPLSFSNCGQPQIASPWAHPLRARLWPRHGVVAYGRRPKNPALHVEEPGTPNPSSGGQARQIPTAAAAGVGSKSPLSLGQDDYGLPVPGSAAPSSLADEPILQRRGVASAAPPAASASEPSAAPRGRRGRRRRQGADASAGQSSSEAGPSGQERQQQQQYSDTDGEEGGLLSGDEEQYYNTEAELSGEDEESDGGTGTAAGGAPGPTELVFRLERRGEGWGEELFPHITVEKRPIFSKSKHKCQHPDPWEAGSLEYYLIEIGVPPGDVDRVVEQAVAWRFTPGGRALIDRRRRSRVERNVRLVVQHLEMEGGIPFGPKGMGAILARVPEIMLCKPTTNDRWDRRAVELVAFQHSHGHCNVPEEWPPNPELGAWVKRQRVARAAGQLSDDRLAILQGLGFEFGEVAQMTDEWEHRFDQLIDWMLWHKENQQRFSWLGIDWGHRGGITARELALWVSLQGEFRRRNLLPAEAIKRFEAIGVDWDAQDGTPAEREWMAQFSRLLYVIERHNTVTRPYLLQTARLGRPKAGTAAASAEGSGVGDGTAAGAAGLGAEEEDAGDDDIYHKSSSAAHRGRAKLQQELAARRRALAVADLRCEAGLRFWLERQRWLWRQGRLPTEQVLMLQLAGVDMERYTSAQWQEEAHLAASLLQRSEIVLTPPPHTSAAAAAPVAAAGPRSAAPSQLQQQGAGLGGRLAAARLARGPAAPSQAPGWGQGVQEPQQQQQQQPYPALGRGMFGGRGLAGPPGSSQGAPGGLASISSRQAPQAVVPQAALAPCAGAGTGTWEPAGEAPAARSGVLRLRVRRWVQTQAALFHEGHLSPAQLRYLAFLGITWIVSDEVMHMGDAAWRARFEQLLALCKQAAADGIPPAAAAAVVADRDLREWLRHQRGLHALGLLRDDRRKLLGALGVGWGHPRGEVERAWDARLSELLAFKAGHGHVQVPAAYAPYPLLGAWVEAQRRLMGVEGALDPSCAAQLAAIGLQPPPMATTAVDAAAGASAGR